MTASPTLVHEGTVARPGARLARTLARSTAAPPPESLTTGFIRSYALFWVLGLGFLWWPVLLLRALRARVRGTTVAFLPLVIVVGLALSLLVAALSGASLPRVFSAGYNVSIWLTLAVLTTVRIDVTAVVRGIAQLAGLQSAAVLAALGLYPVLSGAPLPSTFVLPASLAEDPGFESFTTIRLVAEDYFGGTVLQTAGFFGNPTWAGVLAALGILATVHLLSRGGTRSRALYAGLLVLDGAVLYLSYSRNTWLALGAALLAMAVLTMARRQQWFTLAVTAVSGLGAVVYVLVSIDLGATFEYYNSVREGSLESRTEIYEMTWRAIVDSPFPLIGSGIKERVPGLVASLGTHSGYLGILYRGGWLAIAALVLWLVVLMWRSLRVSPLAMGSAVLATVWFVAEDVDAGHLAPLALVLAFALTDRPSPDGPVGGTRRSRKTPRSG